MRRLNYCTFSLSCVTSQLFKQLRVLLYLLLFFATNWNVHRNGRPKENGVSCQVLFFFILCYVSIYITELWYVTRHVTEFAENHSVLLSRHAASIVCRNRLMKTTAFMRYWRLKSCVISISAAQQPKLLNSRRCCAEQFAALA